MSKTKKAPETPKSTGAFDRIKQAMGVTAKEQDPPTMYERMKEIQRLYPDHEFMIVASTRHFGAGNVLYHSSGRKGLQEITGDDLDRIKDFKDAVHHAKCMQRRHMK